MGKIRPEDIARIEGRPFWPFLYTSSGAAFRSGIRDEWKALLTDRSLHESAYQTFLAEHAGLFFGPSYSQGVVISKLRLGRDHEVDFVVGSDQRSQGLMYEFIELETPHVAPYTKAGNPSARLTHALQQIDDWRRWLAANRAEAKRLFPSKEFSLRDQPYFSFTVIIGRRSTFDDSIHKRNALADRLAVQVRSFDSLLDAFDEKRIRAVSSEFMNEMTRPSVETLHDLANPFWVAFTDADWATIRRNPRFQSMSHIIESNADLLVSHRRLSRRYDQFLEALANASHDERESFYHLYLLYDMF